MRGNMKITKFFAAALLTAFLASCAHMGDKAPVHPVKDTVLFDGIEFKVNSREYRYSPLSVSGKQVAPEELFVILELSLQNSYTSPVPVQFQPRFTLVDGSILYLALETEDSTQRQKTSTSPSELAPRTAYT